MKLPSPESVVALRIEQAMSLLHAAIVTNARASSEVPWSFVYDSVQQVTRRVPRDPPESEPLVPREVAADPSWEAAWHRRVTTERVATGGIVFIAKGQVGDGGEIKVKVLHLVELDAEEFKMLQDQCAADGWSISWQDGERSDVRPGVRQWTRRPGLLVRRA